MALRNTSHIASIMLPADYAESRHRFLDLAARAGATTQPWPCPDETDDGTMLSTDTALLGQPDAATLVIIASGTHGVEGYAGAACQFRFLETFASRYAAPDLAFLLVHAVNPWGYAHDRRSTREGIDLNRNFIDFSQPLPETDYPAYHGLLVEQYRPLPEGWQNQVQLLARIAHAGRRRRLQAAVTSGQYHKPEGLFFGGVQPVPSRRIWENIVAQRAPHHERMVLLDIHTGLGKYGHGELMSHLPSASPDFKQLNQWFQGEVHSMADGASVSPALNGMLTSAFVNKAPARNVAVGLEFGTRSPLIVLAALRAEQWAWNHRTTLPPAQRAKTRQALKQAFAPSDERWHQMAIGRFDDVMQKLVAGALTL